MGLRDLVSGEGLLHCSEMLLYNDPFQPNMGRFGKRIRAEGGMGEGHPNTVRAMAGRTFDECFSVTR